MYADGTCITLTAKTQEELKTKMEKKNSKRIHGMVQQKQNDTKPI